MSGSVLILNGPNLNLLGSREPEIYGTQTLSDIEAVCHRRAKALGLGVDFRQSNSEGELIDWIHAARGAFDAILINGAGYSHTSVAIMDALKACDLPIYEVHLSNIHKRERYRHTSYMAKVSVGSICGYGAMGYELSLEAVARHLGTTQET